MLLYGNKQHYLYCCVTRNTNNNVDDYIDIVIFITIAVLIGCAYSTIIIIVVCCHCDYAAGACKRQL